MFKRVLSVVIALSLLFGFSACGEVQKKNYEVVGQVTDGAGRTVNVRSDAAEATIASVYYVAAPFFVALDISDRVLAVNARNAFLPAADEGIAAAGSVGKGTVDLEKLASYAPTALVHRSNDPSTIEAVEKLGIDVICITVESEDDVIATLRLLGSYFGASEKAEKCVDWIESKFEYIDSIVSKIPESERKTALLMGGDLGRVAGCDMMQSWMIEKAGGIPVVVEGENHNWIDIGVERIFTYDPDVIFCTSSAARGYKVEELLNDTTWSALKSIKNKNIFDMPAKYDSWDMPGLTCVLGCLFMLREMYPEYLPIEDFEDMVDDYYRFMYGQCFDEMLELDYSKY